MFWASQDAQTILQSVYDLGLHVGQLGVPPDFDCDAGLDQWKKDLEKFDLALTSAVCSYAGEDYASLEIVHKTVGFTAAEFRAERIARTQRVSDFARALGIRAVSCHIGFIPGDPTELLYQELLELTRVLCDSCEKNDQDFVLETGQESAAILLTFIEHVERKNLKVNFDPANMIMYQSGDPLNALTLLARYVISVHCKDAHYPAAHGLLGSECLLGDGEVNLPAFLKTLKEVGYQGALCIEREEVDPDKRLADIKTGIKRLQEWKVEAGVKASR